MSRIEALNLYQKLSGRNIKDFKWIYALSLLKLGVVFQQLYAQFLRGTIKEDKYKTFNIIAEACLLYTSPSPRDLSTSRMPSSA